MNRVPHETKETVVHLFWECKIVQNFWTHYVNWLTKYCKHICNLKLSPELVIFGCKDNLKTDSIFDLLLLLAKYLIYRCKVQMVQLNIINFQIILFFIIIISILFVSFIFFFISFFFFFKSQ